MISKLIKRQFSTAGSLVTWGETTFGWGRQPNNNLYVPDKVAGFDDVVEVASGPYHLLFRTKTYQIFSTGLGKDGRLGNQRTTDAETPQLIQGLKSVKVKQLAAGERHSLALSQGGDVYAWGYGGRTGKIFDYLPLLRIQSPVGLGDSGSITEPTLIEDIKDISQIAAGTDFSLAVGNDGKVYGWGDALIVIGGQTDSRPIPLDQINYFLHKHHSNVVKVKTVGLSAFFLLENGRIYVVGQNDGGVFGTRQNPRVISDNTVRSLTKIIDDDFKGEKISDFQLSKNSLIFKTESGAVYYTGMHRKYRPSRFDYSGQVKSIFASYDTVGVIGADGSVNYINDKFIENSSVQGDLIVCRDPLFAKTLAIGGSHRLRYALVQ